MLFAACGCVSWRTATSGGERFRDTTSYLLLSSSTSRERSLSATLLHSFPRTLHNTVLTAHKYQARSSLCKCYAVRVLVWLEGVDRTVPRLVKATRSCVVARVRLASCKTLACQAKAGKNRCHPAHGSVIELCSTARVLLEPGRALGARILHSHACCAANTGLQPCSRQKPARQRKKTWPNPPQKRPRPSTSQKR